MRWARMYAIVCVLVCLCLKVHAAPFELGFDQASYNLLPGEQVTVQLVLRDLDPSNGPALRDLGLISAGGRIIQSSGNASLSLLSITPNPAFDGLVTRYPTDQAFPVANPGNIAGILESTGFLSPPVGVGVDEVVLGTFHLDLSGKVGATATLRAAELDASSLFEENILAGPPPFGFPATTIDDLLTFQQTVVTITPEPTSLAVFGLTATILGVHWVRGRRRRRR